MFYFLLLFCFILKKMQIKVDLLTDLFSRKALVSPCHWCEGWGLQSECFYFLPYKVKRITPPGFWLLGLSDFALLRLWGFLKQRCQTLLGKKENKTASAYLFCCLNKVVEQWMAGLKCSRLSCNWLEQFVESSLVIQT